ncbi:DUF1949 domain-containing protein [Planobispora rosea]|uniref:DUF1949 domain-containing protein n=1 Tax=Planobispora rosea TaxID=35762 RepID=UPI00083AD937|nr:DUF1949 domain-containing protein [Planobispora rosea]
MAEPYLTLEERIEHEIEIKGSRFVCVLAPVSSEEAARAVVAGRLENSLRASPYEVGKVAYGARVGLEVLVREPELEAFSAWVATLTAGRAAVEPGAAVHLREPR